MTREASRRSPHQGEVVKRFGACCRAKVEARRKKRPGPPKDSEVTAGRPPPLCILLLVGGRTGSFTSGIPCEANSSVTSRLLAGISRSPRARDFIESVRSHQLRTQKGCHPHPRHVGSSSSASLAPADPTEWAPRASRIAGQLPSFRQGAESFLCIPAVRLTLLLVEAIARGETHGPGGSLASIT